MARTTGTEPPSSSGPRSDPKFTTASDPVADLRELSDELSMIPEVEGLIRAIAAARILLEDHGYTSVPQRLGDLERRLTRGDDEAVISAISEATGSAGSLRDVVLSVANYETANAQLDTLVRDVEGAAREAAARLGLRVVR